MLEAYILINLKSGIATAVVKEIRKIEGVKSARLITGLHDIIALVEADDLKSLGAFVLSKITGVKDVSTTLTCVVVED
ncbi:Lrp/AsnC ligand binding domain-containing protein [candidate division WOR-3 bacterium]|nr:Lrp/AsnC ligand binding domain-containing protein [candidate division WOR-3 bacterium]